MSMIYKQVYHTCQSKNNEISIYIKVANNLFYLNPEKPDVPLNKNDAFQKVQKRRVQEKR